MRVNALGRGEACHGREFADLVRAAHACHQKSTAATITQAEPVTDDAIDSMMRNAKHDPDLSPLPPCLPAKLEVMAKQLSAAMSI